jgi:putative hemolysin
MFSLIAIFGFVILSAFYSCSETALIGSGRVKLNMLAEQGNHGAKIALSLLGNPGELLATILVGNTLVCVAATAIATSLIGPVYASVAFTLILLIFGEIVPKTLAASHPERYAAILSRGVLFFKVIFKPIVEVSTALTHLILWPVLGGKRGGEHRLSRQELLAAIRLGAREGTLEPSETRMTREILALKDTPVRRLMIAIEDVDSIHETASIDEVLNEIALTQNTRYPVCRNDPSDLIGLLMIKDLLVHQEGARENWRQYVRPLLFSPASLEADELLRDMQIRHIHMAALEEDGRVVGIVTMEDVLEEIVGEIEDETDELKDSIRELGSGGYVVKGDVEVDNLCKVINIDLGHIDQHVTLTEWFENRCKAACGGPIRRIKAGNVRVIQRSTGRYKILVKDPAAGRATTASPPEAAK